MALKEKGFVSPSRSKSGQLGIIVQEADVVEAEKEQVWRAVGRGMLLECGH